MERKFQRIEPAEIDDSVFTMIGEEWMLITAGGPPNFNTMTASWGGLGHLWNRDVAFIFVRPQRYTFEFVEDNETFTLSFFDPEYRDALQYCGTHSGRNVDKVEQMGLTPTTGETGAVYFEEARLVIECRKLYAQDLNASSFVDTDIRADVYAAEDYHRVYVGEIVQVLRR
jgi:flavin reductase (DIM6/NTAB) family NADH-FMN oxidoreductase RutF